MNRKAPQRHPSRAEDRDTAEAGSSTCDLRKVKARCL